MQFQEEVKAPPADGRAALVAASNSSAAERHSVLPAHQPSGHTTLQNLTYEYDNVGNVTRITDTVRSEVHNFYYWFEVTQAGAVTKYYYFSGKRVAVRQSGTLYYLHTDHLGSTSVTSGAQTSKQWYYAYGTVRTTSGTLPTDYTFTGQKADASDGLMYYGARYYDAALGRFTQPDTIVPDQYNPQALNRYSYVLNNPVRFTDPTGHCTNDAYTKAGCPSWMPDAVYGALDLLVSLTVSGSAYAPAGEGQPNDIASLEASANAQWYQGLLLQSYDPYDYAQTAQACVSGDCDAWRIGGAALPIVPGGFAKKVGPEVARKIDNLPEQIHHIASNVNSKWTRRFEDVIEPFGLNLDAAWNKIEGFPHKRGWSGGGGHPDAYHEWVLAMMERIAKEAKEYKKDPTAKFLELWEQRVRSYVRDNPGMLFDDWW